MSENTLKASVKGAKYIFSQQLIVRLLTFLANIYTTRAISLTTLGILQDLDLFRSSLLFISRETIRMALLRNSSAKSCNLQVLVNMSFIPIAAFALLSPFSIYYISTLQPTQLARVYTLLYCCDARNLLGTFLDLLSEPTAL